MNKGNGGGWLFSLPCIRERLIFTIVCSPEVLAHGTWILSGYELTISLQVVPKHSACIPGAMDAAKIAIFSDHTNIVKFKNAEDDGFRKVSGELSMMLKKAPQKIKENWEELERVKRSGL